MQLAKLEYKRAIKGRNLTEHQLEILIDIYGSNNSSIPANELARKKKPKTKGHITASGTVGKIGKAILEANNIPPDAIDTYYDRGKEPPAFFSIVGSYDPLRGWIMHKILKETLEALIKECVLSKYGR